MPGSYPEQAKTWLEVGSGDGDLRMAMWRNFTRLVGEIDVPASSADSFTGNVEGRIHEDVAVVRVNSSPFVYHRSSEWIDAVDRDFVMIKYVEDGEIEGIYAGQRTRAPIGAMMITSLRRTMELKMPRAWKGLFVPKRLLERSKGWHRLLDGRVFQPESMPAIMVGNHIETLIRLGSLRMKEASRVARASLALLAICLTGSETADPGRYRDAEDFSRRVRHFIIQRLSDPALSLESISREFGVSTATLKRKMPGGFRLGSAIRKLRLDGAYRDLLSTTNEKAGIDEIGRRWGIDDERTFRRAFNREFGIAPSRLHRALRKGEVQPQAAAPSMTELKLWFEMT